jgi:hypothetical protein
VRSGHAPIIADTDGRRNQRDRMRRACFGLWTGFVLPVAAASELDR